MARFMKHVGKNKYGSKIVVVFRELPDDPEHCLVVQSDALMDMYHDNLMRTVESNAAQATNDLFEVLSRSHFSDGGQMLNTLHQKRLLQKLHIDDVKLEPLPNRQVPLRTVNEAIAQGKNFAPAAEAEAKKTPAADENPVLVDTAPQTAAPEVGSEEQQKSLAESKLLQARLMEEDAKKLREEAYGLDPDLKKGGRPSKKQAEKVEEVKAKVEEAAETLEKATNGDQ